MIILVRHGEATHHTQHLTGGWTDSDLTEAGRSQLEALAEKLALDFKGPQRKIPHFGKRFKTGCRKRCHYCRTPAYER